MHTRPAEISESAYRGRHAELYDVIYADKPYSQEAGFIHQVIERFGKGGERRLLELACGTGSHGLAFERLGYEVTGIDQSEDMIAVAQQKAARAGARARFTRGDMRSLRWDGEAFDAAVCLFDSIGYVRSNEAIRQVLEGVHHNLRPDGLFIFEFWHAAAMLREYDPLRVRRWELPDGHILRVTRTKLHCAQQLSEVSYDLYELKNDGSYSHLSEVQRNRYFLVQEMRLLLDGAQFEPLKFFAGFSFDEAIDEKTWHILAVARKSPAGRGCDPR